MSILTKWGFRMVRANRSRTITVILAVVGFFALITSSMFVTDGLARAAEAKGYGLYSLINDYVCYAAFFATAPMLFSCFMVTVDECRQDYRVLKSAGATESRIVGSLLLRSLTLDLVGASIGIFLGVGAARLALDADAFRTELTWFFWLSRTSVVLSGGLLVAPCAMLLAALYARIPSRRRARPKQRLLRRTLIRRVFGVGGELGRLSSSKNIRFRAIFSLSFAMCLVACAGMNASIQPIKNAQMIGKDTDVSIRCDSYPADTSALKKIDAALQTCRERGWIEDCTTERHMALWGNVYTYFRLDSDWLTDDALQMQKTRAGLFERADNQFNTYGTSFVPLSQNGRSVQFSSSSDVVFLDDASFDRFARKNGIDAGEDGTILFYPGWPGKAAVPLLNADDAGRDVTLYFLPSSFVSGLKKQGASLFDCLPEADAVSAQKTVRLAGAVSTMPEESFYDKNKLRSQWIVPERMAEQFADILQMYPTDRLSSIEILLRTSDRQAVCNLFREMFRDDPTCEIVKTDFGVGSHHLNAADPTLSHYPGTKNVTSQLYVEDLHQQKEELSALLSYMPQLESILLLFLGSMLFIGILNTAHMNRLTRRHERALLESVGMDKRQQTGMLLYDSARYALHSTFYGVLCFAGYYLIWYRDLPRDLISDRLVVQPEEPYYMFLMLQSNKYFLLSFPHVLAQMWWIFLGGAALIFALLLLTDKLVGRRSRRDELIRILKDDPA